MGSAAVNARRQTSWLTRVLCIVLALAVAGGALPGIATAPATQAQEETTEPQGVEAIVVLAEGVDPVAAAQELGVEPTQIYTEVFNGFAGVLPAGEVATARADRKVDDISPDGIVQAESQIIPTGVSRVGVPHQPGADNLDIASPIDADIAILDTGVRSDHPDLNVAGGVSCVGGNSEDVYGHGTHLAGIAAAIDNDEDVVGVAPGARVWAVKVLKNNGIGSFSTSSAAWIGSSRTARSSTSPTSV